MFYLGLFKSNTSAIGATKGGQREELRFIRYLDSIICIGDENSSPISLEAIQNGDVPIWGCLYPFFSKQRAYAAEFEKQGTRCMIDQFGQRASLNRKCGGDTRHMLSDWEFTSAGGDVVWHGNVLMVFPTYAFDSLKIRIKPGAADFDGPYLQDTKKFWYRFDQMKKSATTDHGKAEMRRWLHQMKKKMELEYPRPADAVSDLPCFRVPLDKILNEGGEHI